MKFFCLVAVVLVGEAIAQQPSLYGYYRADKVQPTRYVPQYQGYTNMRYVSSVPYQQPAYTQPQTYSQPQTVPQSSYIIVNPNYGQQQPQYSAPLPATRLQQSLPEYTSYQPPQTFFRADPVVAQPAPPVAVDPQPPVQTDDQTPEAPEPVQQQEAPVEPAPVQEPAQQEEPEPPVQQQEQAPEPATVPPPPPTAAPTQPPPVKGRLAPYRVTHVRVEEPVIYPQPIYRAGTKTAPPSPPPAKGGRYISPSGFRFPMAPGMRKTPSAPATF